MDERIGILRENIEEYSLLGEESFQRKKYNSATTLFFKALAALFDLHILNQQGFIPSSHTHRFRILEEKYPELYRIADRDFPFYQDSYTKKMNKEAAELLKEDVETVKKIVEK